MYPKKTSSYVRAITVACRKTDNTGLSPDIPTNVSGHTSSWDESREQQGIFTMKARNIQDLMIIGLTYILDFEDQIAREAPKMAEAAQNPELKEIFQKTASKSREYAQKIEQTFENLGKTPERNENHIAKAMINEVRGMIDNTDPGPVRDAALIIAANQQQMFRVASYGSMTHYAELLGKKDAAQGLEENLKDSKGGDEKLTALGEQKVNPEAKAA